MKRTTFLFVLAVAAIACRRHREPRYAETPPPSPPPESPTPSPTPAPVAAGGTCAGACNHYLQCKGNVDPNAHPVCVSKCQSMNLSQQQLLQYEATDCATAIYQAENAGAGGTGTGTGTKSSACNGCVWDGSSCIWLSSGNWGAGPYSGAAAACAASCCPGH